QLSGSRTAHGPGAVRRLFSRAFRRVFRYREPDLQMLGRLAKWGAKGWYAGCSQARQAGRPAPSFTKLNRALATRSRGKLVSVVLWQQCMEFLRDELPSQQFNTWIRPLQVEGDHAELRLYAPNRFVLDWVNDKYLNRIQELLDDLSQGQAPFVSLVIGSRRSTPAPAPSPVTAPVAAPAVGGDTAPAAPAPVVSQGHGFQPDAATQGNAEDEPQPPQRADQGSTLIKHTSYLNRSFTFENFVEGKSNQLARAAAWQVADNPRHGYSPLFLYGGVALGKTQLMPAVGKHLLKKSPAAKSVYLHSGRVVADMVKALQMNAINDFKRYYRSVDALLIDDIQFFAKKERSQEEFFHTFNALLEGGQQVILTSDRYPKEIDGLEERLKSRFGWGLTVAVEPPELETRVAILMKKAEQSRIDLPHDAAFFIAQRI